MHRAIGDSPRHLVHRTGVVLKDAEVLTRRLLRHNPPLYPLYTVVPDLAASTYTSSPTFPPLLYSFLYGHGFKALPPSVDPGWSGENIQGVPQRRLRRKRAQIACVVASAAELMLQVGPEGTIVDFCGGCGYVALVLAVVFRNWKVCVVDMNQVAVRVVTVRAEAAGLDNVRGIVGSVEEWEETFDVAIALHACGNASDVVMEKAFEMRAGMVVVPCCVGGLVSRRAERCRGRRGKGGTNDTATMVEETDGDEEKTSLSRWGKPRAHPLRSVVSDTEYMILAKAADYGEAESGCDGWRSVAKAILEQDRSSWARQVGYQTRISKMRPLDCSPKNDMIVCWPETWSNGFWAPDVDANDMISTVSNAHVLRTLDQDKVREVEEEILARVLHAPSEEASCKFAANMGPRQRKLVHAVAESLGLYHKSVGKGLSRAVLVRRTETWPFHYDGYIGCRAQFVEELADNLISYVPKEASAQRRLLRGRPHHITLISAQDVKTLFKLPLKKDYDISGLLRITFRSLRNSRPKSLGLGRVSESWKEARGRKVVTRNNDAYFVVLDWPEAQQLRRNLGLPNADFHITLGFTVQDIHGVRKGRSTLIENLL